MDFINEQNFVGLHLKLAVMDDIPLQQQDVDFHSEYATTIWNSCSEENRPTLFTNYMIEVSKLAAQKQTTVTIQ